jgi:hypothetical protein
MKRLLLASVAVLGLAGIGQGNAYTIKDQEVRDNYCAVVLWTNDGFVALRSAPSVTDGYRKAKLHAGEYMYIDTHVGNVGPWVFVRLRDLNPRYPVADGWVHSKYIQGFKCDGDA